MKVDRIAIYYPNGQVIMQIGPIQGTPEEIITVSSHGLDDIINKLPELTKHAKGMFQSYEDAKNASSK